jgi:hypothetical protein
MAPTMITKIISSYAEVKNGKRFFLYTSLFGFLIIFASCPTKENEIPGPNIVGIRAEINRILLSPLAFDGAIVAVEGLAHDVKQEASNGGNQSLTTFKLADLQGNFINVSIPGTWEIFVNDYLVVGGTYRRTENKIEAQQIEKIVLEKKK